jgi:Chalcone isomerase-like
MSLLRRHFLVLPFAGLPVVNALVAVPAWAAEPPNKIAGVSFERRVQVAGAELQLNGIGLRAVAWFKAYAAALYLTARASAADQVVATPGPKRLQLRMMRELPAAEFVKAFKQGMARNSAPEAQPRLSSRVERFAQTVAALGTLREGDAVNLDFDPARGMLFSMNGSSRGEAIEGADFYATLLRAFVGDLPYDEKLKAGLLGRAA